MKEEQVKEIMKSLFDTNTGSAYNEDDFELYYPESSIKNILRNIKEIK